MHQRRFLYLKNLKSHRSILLFFFEAFTLFSSFFYNVILQQITFREFNLCKRKIMRPTVAIAGTSITNDTIIYYDHRTNPLSREYIFA